MTKAQATAIAESIERLIQSIVLNITTGPHEHIKQKIKAEREDLARRLREFTTEDGPMISKGGPIS